MSAKPLKNFQRRKPPDNPADFLLYVDDQLKQIQDVLAALRAAVLQLQTFTGVT